MAVVDGDLNVCLLTRNVEKGHGFVPSSWNPSLDDGPMFAANRDFCVSASLKDPLFKVRKNP
jgi:hypothetical protein